MIWAFRTRWRRATTTTVALAVCAGSYWFVFVSLPRDAGAIAAKQLHAGTGGFDVSGVPLDVVIARIENRSDLPIEVDWEALRGIGVWPDTGVPLAMGTTWDNVFTSIAVGVGADSMVWFPDEDGVVHVTTASRAKDNWIVEHQYDVRQWIEPVRLQFGNENSWSDDDRRKDRRRCLLQALQTATVFDRRWKPETDGQSISFDRGWLVLRATPGVHQQVAAFLEKMHWPGAEPTIVRVERAMGAR